MTVFSNNTETSWHWLRKVYLFWVELQLFMSMIFLTPSLFATNYFLLLFFIISQLLSSKPKIKWLIGKRTSIRPIRSIDVTLSAVIFVLLNLSIYRIGWFLSSATIYLISSKMIILFREILITVCQDYL